ncbi:MAG TPA: hypothetical protein VGJ95_21370 [Pseudonocardiaceae bacterium]
MVGFEVGGRAVVVTSVAGLGCAIAVVVVLFVAGATDVVVVAVAGATEVVVVAVAGSAAAGPADGVGASAPPISSKMTPAAVTAPPADRLLSQAHFAVPRSTAARPITSNGKPAIRRNPAKPPDAAPLTSNSSHTTAAATRTAARLDAGSPSSIHSRHSGGAGGHDGSGSQPGGGCQAFGGGGQFGGGLKRRVTNDHHYR